MTWHENGAVAHSMREPAIEFDDVRVWASTGEQILRGIYWHAGAGERFLAERALLSQVLDDGSDHTSPDGVGMRRTPAGNDRPG